MQGGGVRTMTPQHVEAVAKVKGYPFVRIQAPPFLFPKGPFVKYVKSIMTYPANPKLSKEAIVALMSLVQNVLIKHIRGAVGLKSHWGQKTLTHRDLVNVATVCDEFPRTNA